MNEKEFIEEVKKLGIAIDNHKLDQLHQYYKLLIETNKVIDLTNITQEESVYLKHFYDSLTLYMVCDFNKITTLCDIGSGAGFPGLVLKIFFPHLDILLIDSLDKRIKFLNTVIDQLDLTNIKAIHVRAEEYARLHPNSFDIVTSRAVARLNILSELALPLTKVNGYFISMKGNAFDEIKEIDHNLEILKSRIDIIKTFSLPIENSKRTLIKIIKLGNINNKYPRSFKEIKKKPL